MNCYTLKLRHTGSSNHGRGGEGAMITENLSCTISTLQDQTLFQTGGVQMNDDLKANELPAGAGSPCGGAVGSTTSCRAVSRDVLTYATVCSGIECMSVACIGLPLRPVFFSEIEPFPCAVLRAHYPDVPNLGDMSKIQVSNDGKEITNGTTTIRLHERLGILAGGTPCQDVSVAGKRAGMQEGSGTRSSLAFDFVRLARELRPRWVLWENVAGSIDSKNAPDFLRFASALGDCGYSLAWRVLDAQYVRVDGMERAVPQRRRRVWVVGCLGADESVPAQILFEPDCVAWHTPPRRRAGKGFAYSLARRDRVDARLVGEPAGCEPAVARTLECRYDSSPCIDRGQNCIALDGDKLKPREDQRKGGNGFGINEEGAGYTLTGVVSMAQNTRDEVRIVGGDGSIAGALPAEPGMKQQTYVVSTAYKLDSTASNSMKSANPHSGFHETQVAACLDTTTPDPSKGQGGNVIISTNSNGEDVAATLTRDLAKQTGAQQQNGGGVRVSTPRGFCLDRFGQYGDKEIASAMKMRDYKDHTDLVVHEKEGAEGEVP